MNRIHLVRHSVAVLIAASLLGGCSWFHHKSDYYSKAAESRPLEVPPDLDRPVTSNELVVPQAGNTASSSAAVSAAPPAAAAPATSAVASGNGLRVSDTPAHAWQRVGLALERAQVGTVTADEAARSYTVAVNGLGAPTEAAPSGEHHWYSRILHPFGGDSSGAKSSSAPVSGNVTVKVSADGDAARIDVEGSAGDSNAAEAARRVLAVLRDRLS